MEYDLNVNEMEEQRYNEIKTGGEYLELKILIDARENSETSSMKGVMPVVTTRMCGAGSKEIAEMYVILSELKGYYEKEYPVECLLSKITMNCKDFGCINTKFKKEEKDNEN